MHNTFSLAHFWGESSSEKSNNSLLLQSSTTKTKNPVPIWSESKMTKIKFRLKLTQNQSTLAWIQNFSLSFYWIYIFARILPPLLRPDKHVCSWFFFHFSSEIQKWFDKEKNAFENVNKFATRRLWTIIHTSTYFAQ
jgi:hypothetical protein